MICFAKVLHLPAIQRCLDDLMNARRHAGRIAVDALDEQRAVVDLLDDQGLQLGI